jgi:predicted RND superfamily exporter protein
MTSLCTIFGLLPMALGLGEGAEAYASLAIAVIGGLAVSTLLTLVFVPTLYFIVENWRATRKAKFEGHEIRNKHERSKSNFPSKEFRISKFEFWICFGFRYSDFEFYESLWR